MLLTSLVLIALSQQPQEAPSAVVSGRVVDAATGRPIAGVVISPAGPAVAPSPGASGPVRVMTNGQGTFALDGVGAGSLSLSAVKGGYVTATHGQRRPGGSGQPIRVSAGQTIPDIVIRMWRYAAITGTVVDEYGDPAVGTRVQVLQKTFVAGRRRFTPAMSMPTDDRGAFRIANLTPGEYIVRIPSTQTSVPPAYLDAFFMGAPTPLDRRTELARELNAIGSSITPSGSQYTLRAGNQTFSLPNGTLTPRVTASAGTYIYPTLYYPAGSRAEDAAIITLKSGEERAGVDLQAQPVRAVRVSGTLMGPEGPSALTGVRLFPAGADATSQTLEAAATLTDAGGGFTFPAVAPGAYMLSVVRVPRPPLNEHDMHRVSVTPGGSMTISSAPTNDRPGPPPIPADATLFAQMPLAVSDRAIDDLVVPLSAAPRVSGRLEFEGTSEKPAASSLTGMRITLEPADGSRLSDPALATETGRPDDNLAFKTYGVPPGRYLLRLSPVPIGWHLKGAFHDGRDVTDVPLELDSKDAPGIVITFTDRPTSLQGTIRGSDGPDPSAIAIVYPTDPALWPTAPRRLRTARASREGSFSIEALPPGEYYAVAVQEDHVGDWNDPALLQALARYAQTIRLVEGEQKIVALAAAVIR